MYPGLSEADCQVAGFHFRQLMDEGQQQQVIARVRPASADGPSLTTALRQQVGSALVRGGQRLQGVQAVTSRSFSSAPTGERGAIA